MTDKENSGNTEGVGIGHLVSDGEFLSSGEWQVDSSNEVRSGGRCRVWNFEDESWCLSCWSLEELNGEGEVRVRGTWVSTEVN